jgi:hypothetical protein
MHLVGMKEEYMPVKLETAYEVAAFIMKIFIESETNVGAELPRESLDARLIPSEFALLPEALEILKARRYVSENDGSFVLLPRGNEDIELWKAHRDHYFIKKGMF